MKLAVIGATGGTGLAVVSDALGQGHDVKVVARSLDKIQTTHERLKVVKADLTDSTHLVELFRGCDAVLSCIGGKPGLEGSCDCYTTTGKAVITAMREAGVNRLICLTSWGVKDDPNLPFEWPSFLLAVRKNMAEFEDFLSRECGDVNYTVVRPPRLVDEPASSLPVHVGECSRQMVQGFETVQISRVDVARFMLTCLTTDQYDGQMVAITSRKES